MKVIDKRYRDLLQGNSRGTFRVYKDRNYLGFKMLNDLILKRDGVYEKNGRVYHGFYLSDKDKTVGLLSQLYGANGLFSLVNRYNVLSGINKKDVNTDGLIAGIKSTLLDVLDSVEANGYDMVPHIDADLNNELFHGHNEEIQYVGAMTWALSLFVSARKAMRYGIITFDDKADVGNRLCKQIKKIIEFFLYNVIDDENGFGWGYANGCIDPSLFFTYSVIEAYSDFEDNAITDTDEELLAFLNQGVKNEEDRLEVRYRNVCFAVGDRTWAIYKDYLKDNFFTDKFNGKPNVVTAAEIANTARSSALFNNLYIIFIFFYSYMNSRDIKYYYDKSKNRYLESDEKKTEQEKQEFIQTVGRALQFVQNFYDDLKATGNESIVDKHIISFNQRNEIVPKFSKLLNEESIQASSLLPMLVKASNLIALWIQKFPQQGMTDMFDDMLETKMEDKWLWENRKFDILSTERYYEAIADYFDYYDEYEKNYAEKNLNKEQIRVQLEEKLTQELEAKYSAQLERIKAQQENDIRREIERSIRAEYTVEPVIDKKINDAVENALSTKMTAYLKTTFTSIAQSYAKGESGDGESDYLQIRKVLENYLESFISSALNNASKECEVGSEKIRNELRKDLKDFITNYLMFVAEQSKNIYNPVRLSTILKIIDKD